MSSLNKKKDLNKIIETDYFFADFSDEFKEYVKKKFQLRTFDKHQIIYFPKEKITHVYIVHRGRIRIVKVSETGRAITFRHAISGDVFGDEVIIGKKQREEYAEAIVTSDIWIIPLTEFMKMREENLLFAKVYERKLMERCKEYEETLKDSVFYDAVMRIGRKIIREIKREPLPKKELNITHQELANMLGIRRETVTVCLKMFEEDGFIEKQKGSIIIKNPIYFENWLETAKDKKK